MNQKNFMPFYEYRDAVIRQLKEHINDPEYLEALEPDIKKNYDELVEVSEFLGEDQISPNGYALGILLLYPDLP